MTTLLSFFAIAAGLILGYWLYLKLGTGTADATYDAVAFVSATVWVLAGIFLILGGHTVIGLAVLVVFSYVGASKGKQTERRLRSRIGG